ncbi:hypothetical protein FB567DRAFT_446774 [Paraphoma chrysanthemicola]|uniref:Microbial-type PARG catalytic domain-containing protein n=1 Tax=Paraphoma chrysanthemicola TaxID=798071 RepID=A0A8K0VXF5_9PLEO|nr:hypothetical protein FB567DRAFT_446774 [Paraphoma chrysanthemicola]
MGRIDPSQGLAPPSIRKDLRAKQARHIINKTIPALLASNARARRGADSSELIADPAPYRAAVATGNSAVSRTEDADADAMYIKRKGQGRRKIKEPGSSTDGPMQESKSRNSRRSKSTTTTFLDQGISNLALHTTDPSAETRAKQCSIRIISTDTLTAVHILSTPHSKSSHKGRQNICILNMASPLRPGGGVLSGATSQEEFLCARTTLLPSLKESYYRLPEFGGIWTSDVLVFRNARALGDASGEMGVGERAWVDVISAGMLRFPELEDDDADVDVVKKLSKSDTLLVEKKMRAVLRIAQAKGVKKLVLGAWGCGAYGNPVGDIARAWKKVLTPNPGSSGGKKGRAGSTETWPNLEDVIFAISNRKMATAFAQAFDPRIDVETGLGDTVDDLDEDEEEDNVAEELRAKIAEMEGQISQVWNPDLKSRMGVILEGLRAQLRERESADGEESGRVARRESDGEGSGSEEEEDDEDEGGDGTEEEDEGDDNDEPEIVQVPKR